VVSSFFVPFQKVGSQENRNDGLGHIQNQQIEIGNRRRDGPHDPIGLTGIGNHSQVHGKKHYQRQDAENTEKPAAEQGLSLVFRYGINIVKRYHNLFF